jgi:hypothetical protein
LEIHILQIVMVHNMKPRVVGIYQNDDLILTMTMISSSNHVLCIL